jgi:hypothetical protein
MNFDDMLMAIVVGGIALSGTYIRSEYRLWRSHGAAERRRALAQLELHVARMSLQQADALGPSIARLESFIEAEAGIPADVRRERRAVAATGSQSNYPVVELRTQDKRRAAH